MRKADRGLFLLEGGQLSSRRILFAQIPAQDCVDETRLWTKSELASQLHGFVDRGVFGDAVEPKYLVQPEAQQGLQSRLLRSCFGFFADEPVESGLPANNAKHQLLHQAAIDGFKGGFSEREFEQILNKSGLIRVLPQDVNGNLSWFFRVQSLILLFAQLQARVLAYERRV